MEEAVQDLDLDSRKYVWMGNIPLQVHLHDSEVTTVPAPPPLLVLAPRNGYLPLLIPVIKPHFQSSLPPGTDTVWFDYKGLPLKWYIPTGVLFDLLCAEPERPWNIVVHFRGYPADILSPCEGEDSVKWSFINSLKEASFIMNGSTRNVMNMSKPDQIELWRCVAKGDMDGYNRISARLRPGPVVEDGASGTNLGKGLSNRRNHGESDSLETSRTGKIPLRLYLRHLKEVRDDLADALPVECWDEINYINKAVEIPKDEGSTFTLGAALASVLPKLFPNHFSGEESKRSANSSSKGAKSVLEDDKKQRDSAVTSQVESENTLLSSNQVDSEMVQHGLNSAHTSTDQDNNLKPSEVPEDSLRAGIEIVRVQGIEPSLDLPLYWAAQNLVAPEHFIHICIYTKNVGR